MKTQLRIFILVTLLYSWLPGISQTKISGVINRYAAITAITGLDNVTVDDATGFSAGDTVLMIQMKGAIFEPTLENSLSDIKNTGRYEFIAIQQVIGNSIKFRSNFINTFDTAQAVQIVRVPYYQSAKVISTLTCTPWDSTRNKSKGGILAFIVADTLELAADIDVSGNGFFGANKTVTGNTTCYQLPNQLNYKKYGSDSAGLKGEGISQTGFPYTRGRGDLGNAGGGGNGFGSGGGGGAGYADGGKGGQSSAICPDPNPSNRDLGGRGGQAPKDYFAGKTSEQRDRIFMGGGGGSSRGQNASDGSNGANGGGIVFIITQNLKANNHYIRSNGGNVTVDASNQAGGGGGGGGGSLHLSTDNVFGQLNFEAKGGKGGNTGYCSGQGGGGGGGFVWYSGKTIFSGTLTLTGGSPGISSVTPCPGGSTPGFSGGVGDSANYLNPVLNGFLFNLIGSGQTVCYGDIPKKLSGTTPRGGNGIYTYQWQNRNKTTTYNWINISGASTIDYQSPAIYDTTDFRRVVRTTQFRPDGTSFQVTDTSKWIKIMVRPEIKGILIAPADTAMCLGQNPIKIRGSSASGGDGGGLNYAWEESTDNITWNSTDSIQKDYNGTSKLITKYYRRKIINNICIVTSNPALILVYPLIGGNIINPDTVICNGSTPNTLKGFANLSGGAGNNTYRFQWLKNSSDSTHWTPISATDTFQTYNPSALSNTIFYRRLVFSGLRKTCKDTSYRIKISVLPNIGNNLIHLNQTTICQNTKPNRFIGDQLSGGDNSYLYQWESSPDNSTWAPTQAPPLNPDSINYTHDIITTINPVYFRRTVFSGPYKCCVSSSASIKITLQPKIDNNIIVDTSEICSGQTPSVLKQKNELTLTGGDNASYAYQWLRRPVDSTYWKDCYVNNSSFQPGPLYKTNYYKRKVSSGTCVSFSDSLKINVLSQISGNTKPGGKHEVCENTKVATFVGPTVSGGKEGVYRYFWESSTSGTTWESIADDENNKDYTSPPLTQNTFFRRTVKSGYNDCCVSIGDTFIMNVSKHPSLPEAGNEQKLSFKFTTQLHAKPVDIGWGVWSSKNQDIAIVNPKDTATEVNNLPFGKTLFYWTTANGSCPLVTDSVLIEVDDITRYSGFSPNGANPTFIIEGAQNSKIKKLKVFNRWGSEVYSSDNYQNDWDGTAKNGQPLPDDTYFYVFVADGNRVYKGFVVIKR